MTSENELASRAAQVYPEARVLPGRLDEGRTCTYTHLITLSPCRLALPMVAPTRGSITRYR